MRVRAAGPNLGVVIEIDELTKRHGRRTVVDGVGFTARPGRVTGFLGPNGAGKSSTLRILLGLDSADGGSALVGGTPYRRLRDPLRVVGSVLDGSGAHRSRTGRAHLAWMARSNGIPRSRVAEVLDLVGLTGAGRVRSYSTGMGQRLSIAAALLGDPAVLVLDEPLNGLDPEGIRWLRRFLRARAAEGRTVLLSSHVMAEVAATADDLVVIHSGRVVGRGTTAEVTGGHDTLEDAFFALIEAGDSC